MTRNEVLAAIKAAIVEVEQQCGRESPVLPDGIRPVVDLPDWDSLLGVEATLIVEQKIGRELSVESIFVTDGDSPRAQTIDEIANSLFDSFSHKSAT